MVEERHQQPDCSDAIERVPIAGGSQGRSRRRPRERLLFSPLFIEEAVAFSVYGGRREGSRLNWTISDTAETDYGAHETNKFNRIRSLCDRITPKIIEPNNT